MAQEGLQEAQKRLQEAQERLQEAQERFKEAQEGLQGAQERLQEAQVQVAEVRVVLVVRDISTKCSTIYSGTCRRMCFLILYFPLAEHGQPALGYAVPVPRMQPKELQEGPARQTSPQSRG